VKSATLLRYPDNVWQQKEMLKLNPFDDSVFCQFLVIGRWSVKQKHHVSVGECCLTHSPNCTVTGGKVKLQMLYRNPGFVATLVAHGGRATEKVMRAEAAKLGLGGDAASADVFWRANAGVRNIDNNLWEAKWSALPKYLLTLRDGNAAYTYWNSNSNKTFNKYFVAFYPVRDVLLYHGRPVCSTDMGHFKHQLFDGMNATGTTTSLFTYLQANTFQRHRLLVALSNRLVPDG
jgi:hypothetical protein